MRGRGEQQASQNKGNCNFGKAHVMGSFNLNVTSMMFQGQTYEFSWLALDTREPHWIPGSPKP